MFRPTIERTTSTPEIVAQVSDALKRGDTVRLGRWIATPLGPGQHGLVVTVTQFADLSRRGPLVGEHDPKQGDGWGGDPKVVASIDGAPELAARSVVTYWLGDH